MRKVTLHHLAHVRRCTDLTIGGCIAITEADFGAYEKLEADGLVSRVGTGTRYERWGAVTGYRFAITEAGRSALRDTCDHVAEYTDCHCGLNKPTKETAK